jgi:hypothetical protein
MLQKRYLGPEPELNPVPPIKTVPQTEIDGIVSKRLGEQQKKFDATRAADLERMKALETDAAKVTDLQTAIDELNNRYKSKEELSQDALKKERNEQETKFKTLQTERDSWRKKFEEQTLLADLTTAVVKKNKGTDGKDIEVHNPAQLVKFLRPDARVVEQAGKLETRIKYTDDKGKELDLVPDEVIKLMSEDPQHGNFFKSGVIGGLGASGGKQGAGNDGLLTMPQDQFTKRFLEGTLPKRK